VVFAFSIVGVRAARFHAVTAHKVILEGCVQPGGVHVDLPVLYSLTAAAHCRLFCVSSFSEHSVFNVPAQSLAYQKALALKLTCLLFFCLLALLMASRESY
jgi:hypothetical protein